MIKLIPIVLTVWFSFTFPYFVVKFLLEKKKDNEKEKVDFDKITEYLKNEKDLLSFNFKINSKTYNVLPIFKRVSTDEADCVYTDELISITSPEWSIPVSFYQFYNDTFTIKYYVDYNNNGNKNIGIPKGVIDKCKKAYELYYKEYLKLNQKKQVKLFGRDGKFNE